MPALYLLALFAIVLWPTPVDASARGTLDSVLTWLHAMGVPSFVGYDVVEFAANILLFIPLGLLLSFVLRRFWWAVTACVLATCVIELSQGLFLPQRLASGYDILANSLGAVVGALVWKWLARKSHATQGSARRSTHSQ